MEQHILPKLGMKISLELIVVIFLIIHQTIFYHSLLTISVNVLLNLDW